MRLLGRIGLALLGVVLAAGIALAASRLASQPIGLSSEPVSAGSDLAPAEPARSTRPAKRRRTPERPTRTTPTTPVQPTSPPVATAPTTPSTTGDDSGGDRGESPDGDD